MWNNTQAWSEGWTLDEAQIQGKVVLLIEKKDNMKVFEGDDDAHAFVEAKASEGSEYHIKALSLDMKPKEA